MKSSDRVSSSSSTTSTRLRVSGPVSRIVCFPRVRSERPQWGSSSSLALLIGDLNKRHGRITGLTQRDDAELISALAPLANLFGHAPFLASLSGQRAAVAMEFSHYAQVPRFDDDDPPFRPAVGMRA